jgi:hypothetical protein
VWETRSFVWIQLSRSRGWARVQSCIDCYHRVLIATRSALSEASLENGLPFGQISLTSSARHIVARQSLPEFPNNMLALMVPIRKLFTKFSKIFAPAPKPNRNRRSLNAAVWSGSTRNGRDRMSRKCPPYAWRRRKRKRRRAFCDQWFMTEM